MKTAILLLALVAAAVATPWQTGREYVYQYKTRTASGIPALKNQVSGVGLISDVIVQVQSPSELLVKLKELRVARIENDVFPTSWRHELPLQHYQQLDREQAESLQAPFKVLLRQGQVVAIEVDSEEPLYSVNIKRGLVSQLSLSLAKEMRIVAANPEISGNDIEKKLESELSFEVEVEPSVSGSCRTRYTIVPLPEYVARSEETDIPSEIREKNQERDAWVITKTKNFAKCNMRPGFVHSSLVDENEMGSNAVDAEYKRYSSRSSNTRYLVRGEPRHNNFVVERVWTEGEYTILPFATKTESMHVTSNQTLVLRRIESISSPMPTPQRLVRRDVEFQQVQTDEPRMEESEHYLRPEGAEDTVIMTPNHPMYPKLNSRPNLMFASGIEHKNLPVREIQQQIKNLIREVERDIKEVSDLSKNKPSEKVDKIAEALILLNREEIEELYKEIVPTPHPTSQERKVAKQILIDAIALAGTNPAIVLLKEKIVKREIKGEQAAQIIMTMPMTVKTPTPELLRELVQMTKALKDNQNVWGTALLAVTSLIHRACVNPRAQRNNFFFQSTKFCTPAQVEIILPYLKNEMVETMNPEKVTFLVTALGNLGHPEALQMIRPVVRGEKVSEKQVRSTAIYALGRLARTTSSPMVVRVIKDLLQPVFQSPEEPTEVRIAAFVTLMCARPDESFWTEVATGTWFEQSQQVGQFVYSTMESLANLTYPAHMNISRQAALALPLAKPFKLGAHYSKNMVLTHAIPQREIASFLNFGMISGKHSLVPETIYYRTKMFQGNFDLPMVEMALQTQGIQKLINEWIVPTKEEGVPSEMEIQTRKDWPLRASLWAKLVGQYERIFTMDSLKDLLEDGLVEIQDMNNYRVNYQKTITLNDMQAMFPTESGFPVFAVNKMPTLISVTGTIKVESSEAMNPLFPKIPKKFLMKTDIKPFICQTHIVETGVASPLAREIFMVGHKTHALATVPNKMEVKVDLEEKIFEIISKKATDAPNKVELFKFESTPYTAHVKYYDFLNKKQKPIIVLREPATRRETYGEKNLGLNFEVERLADQAIIDMLDMYHEVQPHSYISMFQFALMPHNLRAQKYKVVMNLPSSETEEARLIVKYGQQQQPWNIRKFDVEQELEAKYENPRSERYEEFANMATEFFANPLVECGEECQEIRKEMMVTRDPESRRAMELEEVEEKSEIPVHSVHAELILKGAETRTFRTSMVLKQTPSTLKQRMSLMFEKVVPNKAPFVLRAHGQIQFPRLPLERSRIIDASKTTLGHLIVEMGEPSHQHQIKASLVMAQTSEQKEAARTTPVVRQCLEHETRGLPYSAACLEARLQATLLNKMVLDIQAENELPKSFQNMTYHFDDLVKYQLYPHMSQQRVEIRNPEKKVKVVFDFKPKTQARPYNVLDILMYKPTENTFFKTLQMPATLEAIFPISAKHPIKEKAMNEIMGKQWTPMCKVQPKMITTFDNVTLPYALNDCYHLITKDCSKQVELQVMAKRVAEGKFIKFTVGPIMVEVNPNREVRVDGKRVIVGENEEKLIKSEQLQETVLSIMHPIRKVIVIEAPVHGLRIVSDGESFSVEMSNIYRGRVCGLCGDMNGEKTAELKDPQNCIRTNPEIFAMTYAQKECRRQQELPECHREESRPVHRFEAELSPMARANGPIEYITRVENRGDEVCFSIKPVAKCALGHEAAETIRVEMGFHCVARGNAATELIRRAGKGIVEEMFEKSSDFSEWLAVPQTCVPIEVL